MKLNLLALAFAVCAQSSAPTPRVSEDSPEGTLLAAGTSVETLLQENLVPLQGGLAVTLEPGVRLNRVDGVSTFETHDGNKIEIETGADRLSFPSPVTVLLTDLGWKFNGSGPVKASSFTARRRQAQDDADTNLNSMKEAAKKLSNKVAQPARKLRVRWLYAENAFATAELFNTAAIQQLSHLSPAGF